MGSPIGTKLISLLGGTSSAKKKAGKKSAAKKPAAKRALSLLRMR
jgi:hypothetical protein